MGPPALEVSTQVSGLCPAATPQLRPQSLLPPQLLPCCCLVLLLPLPELGNRGGLPGAACSLTKPSSGCALVPSQGGSEGGSATPADVPRSKLTGKPLSPRAQEIRQAKGSICG